ncbi:hypothetical protein SDC9_179883 [bioreactor metagenome]|uniref:Uncharacterized protein n=1 Tax=bioreactor metagenome TaxID=1076179 RepID=A0A645H030_9ZZZZ
MARHALDVPNVDRLAAADHALILQSRARFKERLAQQRNLATAAANSRRHLDAEERLALAADFVCRHHHMIHRITRPAGDNDDVVKAQKRRVGALAFQRRFYQRAHRNGQQLPRNHRPGRNLPARVEYGDDHRVCDIEVDAVEFEQPRYLFRRNGPREDFAQALVPQQRQRLLVARA